VDGRAVGRVRRRTRGGRIPTLQGVARPVKQATPTSSYAPGLELDRHGAELLLQVLTEREEKNSVAITSDESFGGWTKTFTDPVSARPSSTDSPSTTPSSKPAPTPTVSPYKSARPARSWRTVSQEGCADVLSLQP
jgi:hypothetical protein